MAPIGDDYVRLASRIVKQIDISQLMDPNQDSERTAGDVVSDEEHMSLQDDQELESGNALPAVPSPSSRLAERVVDAEDAREFCISVPFQSHHAYL